MVFGLSEAGFDVVKFLADALLFVSQQVEGDRLRVVGFEELGSFVE